jgi:spore coat polysaccharide biosynthesis protein SpsF (cytidylyltransferase family)
MLVLVQARSSSRRFPRKILHRIYGKTLIEHVILKINKSKYIKNIVVVTSNNKSDDNLVNLLKKNNINYFRGELKNVAKRLLQAAEKYKKKYFMRINADSPLIDFKLIDLSIKIYLKKKYDLITNVFPRFFPSGQSVEIIRTSALKKNIKKMSKIELEHVTSFFYKNYVNFSIKNFSVKKKPINMKLSVDTKKDLYLILKKIKKKEFYSFTILK